MTGLILGRSPNLWLGAFVAVFSSIALIFHVDPTIVVSVDGAAGAIVALVAGTDRIQIAAGNAARDRSSK